MKEDSSPKIIMYTDGSSLGNPGPGGYGTLLLYGKFRKELSAGFLLTTNNRMELRAVIEGLRALKRPGLAVTVVSDSRYVTEAVSQGWLERWAARQFRKKEGLRENADLWTELRPLLRQHQVTMQWIRGHAGHPENETCDRLAVLARAAPDLPADEGFEDLPARMVTLGGGLL